MLNEMVEFGQNSNFKLWNDQEKKQFLKSATYIPKSVDDRSLLLDVSKANIKRLNPAHY